MKNALLLLLLITAFAGCALQDCRTRCENIKPSDTVPPFVEQPLLSTGCYYGALNQKAVGTPSGWVHYREGTESAAWCPPPSDDAKGCDC